MRYAEIRGTRKIISAKKASRYGEYRCPTCGAEVFLKAGHIYTAHFAHMPGLGKPECDEYYPAEDLRRHWETPAAPQHLQKIDRLLLGIELEPFQNALPGLRRWALRLIVPRSYDSHGAIKLDLGGGDLRQISLTVLCNGRQSYRADLNAVDFGAVWASPEVPDEYRHAVEHRIAGLSWNGIAVFAAVAQAIKPRCSSIRWGESYYFVWRSENHIDVPSSLLRNVLEPNIGWACCLIELPDKADPAIAAWLAKSCELQVAPAKREWALLYPAPYGVDDDSSMLIDDAETLLLAIKPVAEAGDITCINGQEHASLRLLGSRPHFLEIAVGQQPPPALIKLTWDATPLNSLTQTHPDSTTQPSVLLVFGQGTSKTLAYLHHADCQAGFMRVRTLEEHILEVHADLRLHGVLAFRRAGEFEWQREELAFQPPEASLASKKGHLSEAHVAHINALIKDRSFDVEIEFGPYGAFFASGTASIDDVLPNAKIPNRLRARIEWICKASCAFVDTERRLVGGLGDRALLRHFSTIQVPARLLANWRAIERDLRAVQALSK